MKFRIGQKIIARLPVGAVFSQDRKYRYILWRRWDSKKPGITFIGLNPSTANELKNDKTIATVMRYAKDWGFGCVYMVNLFAYISTDPKALLSVENTVGELADEYIRVATTLSKDIIFAWGSFKVNGRDQELIKMFPQAKCLCHNADGTPHHPLRISSQIVPIPFLK